MDCVQLEFNFDNVDPRDLHLAQMQRQLDAACESMGKVRRKMFSELGEFKHVVESLVRENAQLKHQIMKLSGQKTEWRYWTNEFLLEECPQPVDIQSALL